MKSVCGGNFSQIPFIPCLLRMNCARKLFFLPAQSHHANFRTSSMSNPLIVRAIDCGYGHIKFADGRDENNNIRCDSFPSQSPAAGAGQLEGGVIQQRDTFVVDVNDRRFEVGKAVALAGHSNQESEVLDHEFASSPAYAARLYGALSYMLPSLKGHDIDFLVLGLPLNTFEKHEAALEKRFSGEHKVNVSGAKITIKQCIVYPQPLGAYYAFYQEHLKKASQKKPPMALVIDPGYNTVDWFVCKGMSASEGRSKAVLRGMSAWLRVVAEKVVKDTRSDASVTEVVRRIDDAMSSGHPFTLYGKEVDLTPFLAAGATVIEEAAQAVKNSVGSGADIDVIVVAGGGAKLYTEAIRAKFPRHEVVTLAHPAFANVRGFQLMGERLALSASRASGAA